jgi:FkbM family methyltransferase
MYRAALGALGRASLQPLWALITEISQRFAGYNVHTDIEKSGEARMLRRLAPTLGDGVLIDAGANHGDYTALLRTLFPDRRIYAFEPSGHASTVLRSRFAGDSNISVIQAGLSEQAQTAMLYGDRLGSQVGSVYARRLEHYSATVVPQERADFFTLDDFCREHDVHAIALLKLDVEGHELAALRGAGALFARGAIGAVQFEFGGCAIDARIYFQDFWYWLHERGYEIFRVLPSGELYPIPRYSERYEVFWAVNYVALRATR